MDARTGFVTQLTMDPVEAVERAAAMEFDFVELMMDGDNERTRLDGESVADALDEHGLDLLVHLPFALDVGSPFEHVRAGAVEELRACLALAGGIGAEKAVLHASSDAWDPAWDDAEIREHVFESVRELDAVGADHGVEVCVENIPGGFVDLSDFESLFAETDASMTFDTGHARIDGYDGRGMANFVGEHADRVSHFHLNDTRVPRDEHLPFGAGTLDFEVILAALADAGWSGTLSLEVFTLDWEYVATSARRLDERLAEF